MKTMKRLVAIALAFLMILGSFSMGAYAWDANTDDGKTLSITTKIFRLVDGVWTETEKVKQGEEVRARIYLDTDYYTNSGELLFFYNNDFFTDSFGSIKNNVTVNPYYSVLPYEISGTFVGQESNATAESLMVGYGKITADFADKHNFVCISYKFGGNTNQMLSDSNWLFEIPLTVKADATGTGDFFAVEETTRSTSFKRGYINVPKGPYDGTIATITGMSNWDATLNYDSQPVSIFDNFVAVSFDTGLGSFADKSTLFNAEGDANDKLDIPTPVRANYKFVGWKLKGADDSTAVEITKFPAASGEYEAVWKSTTASDEELTFITKIYRQDSVTGEWIETKKVAPGEKVKARLFVDTSYFTNSGSIIVFYDGDFFTDEYTRNNRPITLVTNPSATSSAVINGVEGQFTPLTADNYALQDLVDYGYVTQDFVDEHPAFTIRYEFTAEDAESPTNSKISGDEWFAEFDLTVLGSDELGDTMGDFFVVDKTIKRPGDGKYAYINIPRGEEGGTREDTESMHIWEVNATIDSTPVYINSSITLDANGGAFDAADTSSYVIEGVIGDTVDYSAVPALDREGFTFKGWVDASIENPTEDDVVDLPAEMPYDDVTYKALWISKVQIKFDINGTEIVKNVTPGDPFEAPEVPEMEGNMFIGWADTQNREMPIVLPSVYPAVNEDYYAIFNARSYNVNYYVLDPVTSRFDLVSFGSVTYGDKIVTVPGQYAAPEGYALSKAYADVGLTTEFAAGQTMPASEVNLYFYLEEVVYDAVFMVDGVEYARVPVLYGSDVIAPEDPTKEGYDFAGWDPFVGTMDQAGIVYEANWTPAEYTVTWVVMGEQYEQFPLLFGEEMEYTSDPDVPGYEFIGWSEDENATEEGEIADTMPAKNLTYYAVLKAKQYTITFAETGDTVIDPITQDFGSEIAAPADPVKEGYTFNGWVDLDGNAAEVPATMPAENVVLKADWSVNEYTVTWIFDNGAADQVDTYEFGAEIVAPADPEKVGYTFDDWSPAVEANMPAMDLTYTAVYTVNSYDAIFNANGGTFADGAASVTVPTEYGTKIEAPEAPEKQGYVFAGWDALVGEMGTEEQTFTAQWDAATDTPYVVNYYTMDTAGDYDEENPVVDNRTGITDTTVTAITNFPEGFYVDTEKSKLSEEKLKADGTTVLYVYYARELYTVTFDANGGELEGESTANYYFGADVSVPVATKDGYTFAGWDKNVSTVAVANADYVAQWTVNDYTITFDAEGGTAIDPIKAAYGSEVNAPAAVTTKTGYTFGGWAETEGETDAANAVTFPVTMPLNGTTYYAIWTPNKYTITFNTDGGSAIDPITQDYATTVTEPADPTKEGHTFAGWDIEIPDTMPAEDMTITAQWTVNSYDVTWNIDGVETTDEVEYGAEIVAPAAPEKPGYTFAGWSPAVPSTMPAEEQTFEATWDAIEYTITFNTDGGSDVAAIVADYEAPITAPADPEKQGYDFAGWVDAEGNAVAIPSTMPLGGMEVIATWTPKNDTPFTVIVNYVDYSTGEAMTEVYDSYTGTTGYAIEIVEEIPDELAENTVYVLLDDLKITNYELDKEAANEFTGVVAADGSTVLNLYYVPVKRTATFDANGGAWDDGDVTKAVQVSHGSLVKPAAPADPVREGYTFNGWIGLDDATKLTSDRPFRADWKANVYTLTYDVDGVMENVGYEYNAIVTKPVDPSKEGHTFTGWEPAIPDNMPANDVTVKATWSVNSYDVTWNVDGVETTESVEYGAAIVAPADPVKEGYTFTGWSPAVPSTMPAEEQTFAAQWAVNPYTVTYYVFEPATGKFAAAGTATVDFGAVVPTDLPSTYTVPAGYTLIAKAYTDVALTSALADGATMPANDITLYYELKANTYDAVFTVDGEEFATVPTVFGEQITAPSNPTKDGYTFAGWEPAVGTMDTVGGESYEATWEAKTYNAIFKANGGLFADGETTTVVPTKFGAAIVAPAAPVKAGHKFAGWNPAVDATMPAKDVTYVATYTVEKYTITFNTDGGSEVAPITQDFGTAITAPTAPTKEGHSFAGWEGLPTTMPEGGATVTALWTKNNYTVSWNVDGSIIKSESLAYGAAIEAPANPTKEGNTFAGWTPNVAATMPAQNVEYTATWTVNEYKATFDANGGKFADGTTITKAFAYGAAVAAPEIPTMDGYAFAGWEPALGTMPAADTTYKAVWTIGDAKGYTVEVYTMDTTGAYGAPETQTLTAKVGETVKVTVTPAEGFYLDTNEVNVLEAVMKADEAVVLKVYYGREKYAITFNGNEGTVNGEASVSADYYYGSAVYAPATVREGYSLTGWSPELSTVAVADATYDAQWAINQYTISFNGNGGSNVLPITQDYGTAVTAPEAPVMEGYKFIGWADASVENPTEIDVVELPSTMPAENSAYQAVWALDQFTITFYDDSTMTNAIQTTENNYGGPITVPVEPEREGYSFVGWVDEATGKVVDFDTTVYTPAKDVNYYATWEVNENKLVYRTYNGIYEEYMVAYGEELPVPATNPTRVGYTFTGWLPEIPATMPDKQVNIAAQWKINSYNANFYKDAGDAEAFETVEVEYDGYIEIPENEPTKAGYEFAGWSTDGETVLDDLGTIGAADVDFYAVWTEATNVVYKVEHYYMDVNKAYPETATRVDTFNNGTTNAKVTATPDTDATNFIVDTIKSELEGIVKADGSLVLKVYYEREISVLKVDVDGVVTEFEYPYEAPVEDVADPTKEGHTFAGWVDGNNNPVEFPETMPDQDTTIKATWTVNEYDVTYIVDGTIYEGPSAVKYGATIPVPAAPEKAGYEFAGWSPEVPATMPAEDLEFTAQWTANSNVKYILEVYEMDTEGNYPDDATEIVTYDDGVVGTTKTVDYVVPTGFTLDTAKSVLEGRIPETGTLILEAYVIRNKYVFTVNVDGTETSTEYFYNEVVDAVADPEKDGYVFAGWADANGDATAIPVVMPANDVTVYATWDADSFSAAFDAGEGVFESTGDSIVEADVTFGEDIVPPAEEPVREGYEFLGWATPDAPETVVTDYGKMDSDGAEFVAVWSQTHYTVVFYDYKPVEGGTLTPDEKYVYASSDKMMGDTVTVPEAPVFEHFTFLGWSEIEGDKNHIITATEFTMPAENYELYAIYEPIKVMLIPKNDTCKTVIDRAGGTVDDYNAETSQWYVYGLEEYIMETDLLENYIDVSGDGRIEIVYHENGLGSTWEYTGTGTLINVYNRMGTPDDTSDDVLVEAFYIVIFGDINGDAAIESIDATFIYDEAALITAWSNPRSKTYAHYRAKAADITGDGMVDGIDGDYVGDHVLGIVRIDQVTGRLKSK